MLPGWRITVLLLLLEAAGSEAQSGDGDLDTELRLSCSSHISIRGPSSLTCQLFGRSSNEDDEDGERETIKKMIVCQVGWMKDGRKEKCLQAHGATVTSEDLLPLSAVNVTVHRKGGGQISTTVYLLKIVKPKSPRVWNVTSEPQLNRTVVYIQIPYSNDYLTLDNQLFQLNLWTKGSNITQNVSSQNFLQINMQHLRKHSEYQVRVRAIPQGYLQGTWSEWSEVYTFFTPPEEKRPPSPDEWQLTMYVLIACFISVVVVLSSVFIFWKNKIFTYMWPSIPHPKQTLVQICKPNKGLLLNLNPEVFSSLKVYPLEKTNFEESEPSLGLAAADGSQSSSNQSSDCRSTTSVSTEELEISALLSRSSSDGEDSLQSSSPSPVNVLQREDEAQDLQLEHGSRGKAFGLNQPEEAYVTMSSFYQIK